MVCKIPECGRNLYAKGFCAKHYAASRRPIYVRMCDRICKINGCGQHAKAKGLCQKCLDHTRRPTQSEKLQLRLCARNARDGNCKNSAIDGKFLCAIHQKMADIREQERRVSRIQTQAYRVIASSVTWHLWHINRGSRAYAGMPFWDGWNPKNGGSIRAGVVWVLHNLGPRPEGRWELHIIDRRLGFVPDNLCWVPKEKHKSEEMIAVLLLRLSQLQLENQSLRTALTMQSQEAVFCG